MIKKLFFLPLLIFLAITAQAQYSIQSVVADAKTGHAMERAAVRLLQPVESVLFKGQTTHSTGRF